VPDILPVHCPLCAARLEQRVIDTLARRACPHCDYVHYQDPKVAVGALIEDGQGRLLYTHRNHQPQMGAWALPSGFVDRGEELHHAVIREVREETGLDTAVDDLLGVFSRADDPVIFIVYTLHQIGGQLAPGPEAHDVRFFAEAELPPPAFPSDPDILAAWRARRSAATDKAQTETPSG
jgi:ADP-ribose pyrophosphatase YjhB (NUDIX family)